MNDNYRCVSENIRNLSLKYGTQIPRLVAVTKYQPVERILALYSLGQIHFGESKVQDLVEKASRLPKDIRWHFIGKIQSNKCKQLAKVDNLFQVESLDSEYIASELNKCLTKKINVYIQINTSGEESKNGITFDDQTTLFNMVKYIINDCNNLKFCGLMTIGHPDLDKCEKCFSILSRLRREVEKNFPEIGEMYIM